MARTMTFAEAITRFESLVTTGIDAGEAIQEAVDRIYEMGRYPGTTREIVLSEGDFIRDEEQDQWYLLFDEDLNDGAIGFRSRDRGWSIVDHTALYKDGVNMGDSEFVDLGTIEIDAVNMRKYRCPLGFCPSSGPYYCLMKLESPTLDDDSEIPFQSVGALKVAIQAVCYEYVGDEDRANTLWGKFDTFIKMSERQSHGPKRWTMGIDSSLKRKPRQFN